MPRVPVRRLAAHMLTAPWERDALIDVARDVLSNRKDTPETIVAHVLSEWRQPYPPDAHTLAHLIAARIEIRSRRVPSCTEPPAGFQVPSFRELGLPVLDSAETLAELLAITPGELIWLADVQGRLSGTEKSGHYIQSWLPKHSGGRRLAEAPLPRLKSAQRHILRDMLKKVPVHPAAFGFVLGRSCLQSASRHAGEEGVFGCDLADFFASVPSRRVHAIFRCLGYPPEIARLLVGLCTTRTPTDVANALLTRERAVWVQPHLPQGAPTSPALANPAAWRLDVRLSGLARRLGANYSRYADDLAFSGPRGLAFEGGVPVSELVSEIASECGFRLNPAKTRIMRQGRRQQITGVVVNSHINIPRRDYDRLKALLTNCVRHGPESQNRIAHPAFQEHLNGRITWVENVNLRRGTKLRAIFDRIDWS